MKRFNPSAAPINAIADGLIHEFPERSIYKRLALGADLSQGSQQLVVGGIGSGKTTELLLAQRELAKRAEILPVYVDVSSVTDLDAVNSGALLASLGLSLWTHVEGNSNVPRDVQAAYSQIRKAAYGYTDVSPDLGDFDDREDWNLRTTQVPGKLNPPSSNLKRDVTDLAKSVGVLTAFLKDQGKDVVSIFDGLDRLNKVDQFWTVVEQDLRALRPLQISVVAAGPLAILYGQGRVIQDYFEYVHYLAPAMASPAKSPFLLDVLKLRGAGDLMSEQQMWNLCLASGGVLRDLISLARSTAESAYLNDADEATDLHVQKAIQQLGNSYLLGLGTNQIEGLRRVINGDGFAPSDPASLELLISRRVLEQAGSRYEVHPALRLLLK